MNDWWRGSVTYQVYPRSFQDSNGDGIGDLKGITERLRYIASLGVDAVWLSPIFTSPMADMGYDVSDYTDIDPLFGTLEDFDRFVAKAHEFGLKVVIDQVLSHSSDQHPFFVESRKDRENPKADWYVWADAQSDGTPPNNWSSVFGGSAWEWDGHRKQYYLHNFLSSQPDFNFHNKEVQDWLLDTMRFWLDRGVDGFRLDTVNFYFHDAKLRKNPARKGEPQVNPYEMQLHKFSKTRPENLDFLARMRELTDEYGASMVGEVGDSTRAVEIMAEYTSGDKHLHQAYSFDMLGPEFTPKHFRQKIETFFKKAPDGWPTWAFSNHDVIRHLTRWEEHGADQDSLAKLAAAMLLSFPGSVCLYQGEELGQTETELEFAELTDPPGIRFWPDYKGRDGCRTPMVWDANGNTSGGFSEGRPWLPVKPPQLARNVAAQEAQSDSVLHFYRHMLEFRAERVELHGRGPAHFYNRPNPVLMFQREGLICAFNLGTEAVDTNLPPEGQGGILVGPSQTAELNGRELKLGPNGFAFVDVA
ncbi:alpha-amylase family glycosyl hydrolase [Paracoccus albus]|uniref:alpha-amylase family glycosyl hydrolase n=1 Tax=Paracoccus albus TaxID=3017784 RepID=UPI0022F02C14|nr:alpha-amylase family glycosyl hydrolase [Paracoccus albus]WBU61910.1 alpha-amylase family glycosyl hydrolase [Paracoccus albus]